MIRQIQTEKLPIKMWVDEIEEGALEQAKNLANFPFAADHIALMADCHKGFGMPIGGVMATQEVIVPNAVGVDIGCGMCAIQTSLIDIPRKDLKHVISAIHSRIPVGHKHHKVARDTRKMPPVDSSKPMPVAEREYNSACRQLGTLGGGNHFVEIQKGSDGQIWIMIHSGSRNIGKQVADYYNRLAVKRNAEWQSPVPRSHQLAYLYLDSEEGRQYIREMNYCVDFAYASRKEMMESVIDLCKGYFGKSFNHAPMINIAHNYAAIEKHYGKEVVVHRKGATKAGKETVGIIPGSQGANSYIVQGKGNTESFESCSHGAGRVMGRKQAIRSLDYQDEVKKLNDKGILHAIRNQRDLDEASAAYKDISLVMKQQRDLVDVHVELTPLAVIKG